MSTKRKCGKCGKLGHQARTCGRDSAYKPRRKASGSWLNKITGKLDDALSESTAAPTLATPTVEFAPVSIAPDELPPSNPGDPFADLPRLDLPNTAPPSGDAPTDADAPSDTGKATEAKIEFSNDELVAIAENLVTDAMNASAAYCNERGFFAIGGPFSKIVGKAAGVIVKAQATKMEVDSEEGAAWILALAGGTNGVQCFRAYQADRKKAETTNGKPSAQAPQQPTGAPGSVSPIRPAPEPAQPAQVPFPFVGGVV
jgi:hypothetical protein